MKLCPNCKAELDDNARFCLCCMTSLEEKEQIQPPVRPARRWPLVLLCFLGLCAFLIAIARINTAPPTAPNDPSDTGTGATQSAADDSVAAPEKSEPICQTADGVTYTFRPATAADHPTAVTLENYYVLIRVEGTPSDGVYRVPTFVNNNTAALVCAVADGAFAGTGAQAIDLGYNVRYVWGNAFGGCALTDLHLHEDVFIDRATFSGCTQSLTIHCPEYLENTQGARWSDLAVSYGFRWQSEAI